jgi:hypothetical protein
MEHTFRATLADDFLEITWIRGIEKEDKTEKVRKIPHGTVKNTLS